VHGIKKVGNHWPKWQARKLHGVTASNIWDQMPCSFQTVCSCHIGIAQIPFVVHRAYDAAPTEQPQHSIAYLMSRRMSWLIRKAIIF